MFIIVWRGWGVIVPVFLAAGLAAAAAAAKLFGPARTPLTQGLLFVIAGLIAGGAIWFTARAIEARPGRILIDKATGREIKVGANAGSFFFVPTRYWAFISVGLALVLAVVGVNK